MTIRSNFGDRGAREIAHWGAISGTGDLDGDYPTHVFLIPHFGCYHMCTCSLVQLGNQLVQNCRDKKHHIHKIFHAKYNS